MKKIMIIMLLAGSAAVFGSALNLNFFINPRFKLAEVDKLTTQLSEATSDSLMSVNVYLGDIFEEPASDKAIFAGLEKLPGLLFAPEDFLHHYRCRYPNFAFLAANIESDSVMTVKKFKLTSDSLKVGIFCVYTPDFAVKKPLPDGVKLDSDINEVVEKQLEALKDEGCDEIILLTSLSKYVIKYLVKSFEIDTVISFDYVSNKNGILKGKKQTEFYAIESSGGNLGRLQITKGKMGVNREWQERSWHNARGGK